ncbi:hypothetical protein [Streptomyces hiroshimensis]|uniref:Uncharacterized protein n=1 Tax=Streptomyces hiroshimensis TaxID=66424 RepID=A0ABQ2YGR5_9ACTN|nr:hypothetical protein [Streptomyces hiroshimensis]GGX82554.1 hypothetical protein GCM10010324_30220 [Streptomyces hiroshimensis]
MIVKMVGELAPHIQALSVICACFPHLPAAYLETGVVFLPEEMVSGLTINLHGCRADFEAWRDALDLDATSPTVEQCFNGGRCFLADAYGAFEGTPVHLRGFIEADDVLPAPSAAP